MSRSTPIRDVAGNIIGLRSVAQETDPVQETLDASLKAVGASPAPQAAPVPKQDTIAIPSPLRMVIGAVAVCAWAISLVLVARSSQPAPRIAPVPIATMIPTHTPSPATTPATVPPTPTELPLLPTPVPPPAATPQAAPALTFCADRKSIWGETHQCASSQAEADALADAEIGRINATAEAIRRAQ